MAITLPLEVCEALAAQAGGANSLFDVDLERGLVTGPDGHTYRFEFDAGRREKLLNGLDDIALTLQAETEIRAFERARRKRLPWLEISPCPD